MDYRERESHARDVYLTQHTSRMGTVRVKQEEADTRIIEESSRKFGRKERGHKGENSKQGVTSVEDLTLISNMNARHKYFK